MAWDDERVAILKKMWLEGNSASEIAKELGNITRNAVIGKVHRLGLSNRDANISKLFTRPRVSVGLNYLWEVFLQDMIKISQMNRKACCVYFQNKR